MEKLVWITLIGQGILILAVGYSIVSLLVFIGIPLEALLKLAAIVLALYIGAGLILSR